MTPKEKRFVDEYLKDLNATKAGLRAGYMNSATGRQLLARPHVVEAITVAKVKRSKRTDVDVDWVLTRLASEAVADLADLYTESGQLKPIAEWPLIWRQGLVSGLNVDENIVDGKTLGQVTKIKLSDRIKQIELIGKHIDVQAFAERKEIGGIGGGPVKVEDVSTTEAARLILAALREANEIQE